MFLSAGWMAFMLPLFEFGFVFWSVFCADLLWFWLSSSNLYRVAMFALAIWISSSSSSSGSGWVHGCLESVSASTFSVPLIQIVSKVRWLSFIFSLWSLLLVMSGRACFSRIGTSGAWSVHIWNLSLGRPSMNMAVLVHAHVIPNSSNSHIAYLDSASVKNLEPAWTGFQSPFACSCFKTNPIPNSLDASEMSLVLLSGL